MPILLPAIPTADEVGQRIRTALTPAIEQARRLDVEVWLMFRGGDVEVGLFGDDAASHNPLLIRLVRDPVAKVLDGCTVPTAPDADGRRLLSRLSPCTGELGVKAPPRTGVDDSWAAALDRDPLRLPSIGGWDRLA